MTSNLYLGRYSRNVKITDSSYWPFNIYKIETQTLSSFNILRAKQKFDAH